MAITTATHSVEFFALDTWYEITFNLDIECEEGQKGDYYNPPIDDEYCYVEESATIKMWTRDNDPCPFDSLQQWEKDAGKVIVNAHLENIGQYELMELFMANWIDPEEERADMMRKEME